MEKTPIGFIFCSKCGRKSESILKTNNEWNCDSCGYPFPTDNEGKIRQNSWKIEQVDAARCDMCNKLTGITPETLSGNLLLCVYGCNDWKTNGYSGHVVAIRFRQVWYSQSWFLSGKKKGIQLATTPRDRVTLSILNRFAKAGGHREFLSVSKSIPAKIFWLDRNAIAYYTYTVQSITNVPTLHQIFVRPEYRRRGIATKLIMDFIRQNTQSSKDKLAIESPDDEITQLLCKIGEWKRKNDEILYGRILHLPSSM